MESSKPSPKQLAFQDWEFGIFLHFGIRTFYEGWKDMDKRPMSVKDFNPSSLDCEQWVKTAKDAGVKYMVLTAKHHDGFANWPSKYTDFSVASTPWKNGKGDVVKEFTDACHKHDMKVGLYYSPYDHNAPAYKDHKAYDDYFINQVSEILTGYGEINMLWFDGCGSEGHTYDWKRVIGEVRRMQPGILIFNMGDPDYRWVGNEDGVAPCPVRNTVNSVSFSIMTDQKDHVNDMGKWLPAECDTTMRAHYWFYQDHDAATVKSLEELMGLYYYSVGRGCNLLLNIGPDRRGLLPEPDATRLREFGAEIQRRFATPIATTEDFTITEKRLEYMNESGFFADHVILSEALEHGEHIARFAVYVMPFKYGTGTQREQAKIKVWEGETVGHKAICRFPLIRTKRLFIDILEANGSAAIRSVAVFAADKRI